MNFFIVIPTKNSAAYLDRSLGSLLLQDGHFLAHVHVQDSVSEDETANVVERWRSWLSSAPRSNIKLTFTSGPDENVYDGVTKAFDRHQPSPETIMTWLGSDDVLMPGTLATVSAILSDCPEIQWLTGQSFTAAEDGSNYSPPRAQQFTRHNLAAGLHDGRTHQFVMQEGTFWTAHLWRLAGGLNTDCKYAADSRLWIDFAKHTPLYSVGFPLGRYSFRSGQLGSYKTSYHDELDALNRRLGIYNIDDNQVFSVSKGYGQQNWSIRIAEADSKFARYPSTQSYLRSMAVKILRKPKRLIGSGMRRVLWNLGKA